MAIFGRGRKTEPAADNGAPFEVTLSDGQVYEVARRVDCIGDNCPRPQLLTKKALGDARANEVIQVLVDNPNSMEAIPPMLPALGATHLETVKGERRWEIYLRKN